MLCLLYSKLFPRIKPFEKKEHAVLGRWLFIWYHICRSVLKKKKKNRLNDGINLKAQGIQLWAETGSGKTVIVTIFHSVQTGQFLYLWEWLRENVRAPVLCLSLHQLFPLLLCDSLSNSVWLTSYSNARVMRKPGKDINSQDSIFSIRLLQINLILYLSS